MTKIKIFHFFIQFQNQANHRSQQQQQPPSKFTSKPYPTNIPNHEAARDQIRRDHQPNVSARLKIRQNQPNQQNQDSNPKI
jgi:hypothetical protein